MWDGTLSIRDTRSGCGGGSTVVWTSVDIIWKMKMADTRQALAAPSIDATKTTPETPANTRIRMISAVTS